LAEEKTKVQKPGPSSATKREVSKSQKSQPKKKELAKKSEPPKKLRQSGRKRGPLPFEEASSESEASSSKSEEKPTKKRAKKAATGITTEREGGRRAKSKAQSHKKGSKPLRSVRQTSFFVPTFQIETNKQISTKYTKGKKQKGLDPHHVSYASYLKVGDYAHLFRKVPPAIQMAGPLLKVCILSLLPAHFEGSERDSDMSYLQRIRRDTR
jgi:hypothetical protein